MRAALSSPLAPALRRHFLRRRSADHRPHRGLQHPAMPLPAVLYVSVTLLVPLVVLVVYSFWPTSPTGQILHTWTIDNYRRFFTESAYPTLLLRTLWFVGLSSAAAVAVALPFAYFVATKVAPKRRIYWLLLAMIPFWTSYLIRVFAWMNIFGDQGLLNSGLMRLHIISQPLQILSFTRWDVLFTFVYLLFPLCFLSAYIALERINPALREAAADLGARPRQSAMRITFPLIRTGLLAGFAFSFITMMGDYATPQLIGGTEGTLFVNLIVNQFGATVEWGFGAALAVMMLLAVVLMLVALRLVLGAAKAAGEYTMEYRKQRSPGLFAYSIGVVGLLYVPVVLLVIFAFNRSDVVGFPFEGFSTQWFTTVFNDSILLDALKTSLQVAATAVAISVALGSVAAVQLARGRGFLRNLSLGIISLPLLFPPVVLGLGIIIGMNALHIQRGLWTIIIGHTLLTLPIVVLLLVVRLEGLDPNIELAAMDLGARPWRTFIRVSLPQALPAILAAAMIAFAISMDEFIMTFLITGNQTTLPLYIWGSIRFTISPELNALSTLMLAFSFILLTVGTLIGIGRTRLLRLR